MSTTEQERELLAKADLTIQNLLDDGGALPPEMALTFYRKIMEQVTIFNSVRQIQMSRNEMRIPTIASAGRMLRVARNMYSSSDGSVGYDYGFGAPNRGFSKAERAKVQTGIIDLKTNELIAVMYLTYELLEDVIEGGAIDNAAFQTLVLDIMAQQIALDLEEKLTLGDTSSSDDFLALQNGIVKFAQSNIVNQQNAPINHLLFAQMIKSLPQRFRNQLPTYAFYVNANVEIDYRAQMAQRQTTMGDQMLSGTTPVNILGVPMVRATFMPSNTIVLTDPRNILFGVQRKFRLATQRDEENRLIKLIVTMRVGQQVEQEEMMVKAINVGTLF
jgi:HK97 family phage major capsid protein